MGLATVLSRSQDGLHAPLVTVEVHAGPGLPGMSIVGLPDAAVREARDRVKAAIQNCGFRFPTNRRLTVNLAPADLPKDGGRFDLAIALGILSVSEQIPAAALEGLEILGELSLSGAVRPIQGALPAALQCAASGRRLLLPLANGGEALLARQAKVLVAEHLGALCEALHAGQLAEAVAKNIASATEAHLDEPPDLRDVRGQHAARRALELAAAGGHSLLMLGPPGAGKTMLARRLPGLLPPMSEAEALEVAAVASVTTTGFDPRHWGLRPFRAPHHTASAVALVGGGSTPRPGEITLAHGGVLFLDELPEFSRRVLEVLREPLESGTVTVSRAARQVDFPACFQLVAAMNPCPCGYLGDTVHGCRCTPDQVQRYRARISGPLLDRIDLQIFVPRVEQKLLTATSAPTGPDSAAVRLRVCSAQARQIARQGVLNSRLSAKQLEHHCPVATAARALLETALQRLALSARAYHRVLKVARTAADLAESEIVEAAHVAEAVQYRALENGG